MLSVTERIELGLELSRLAGALEFLASKVGDEEPEVAPQIAIMLTKVGQDVQAAAVKYAQETID